MPTFLKRRYMRGRPRLLERTLGAGVLAILAIILTSFLLTGGLLRSGAARQGFVADARTILGVPTDPLFSVKPGNQKPSPPPPETRVAEVLLPDQIEKHSRELQFISLTANAQPKTTAQNAHDPSATGNESTGSPTSDDAGDLAEAARTRNGKWLFVGRYGLGKDAALLSAKLADMTVPERARELCLARQPAGSAAVTLGRGGWKSQDGHRIGFWAGRYYSEVNDARGLPQESQSSDVDLLAAALAGRQLVYGGENFAPEAVAATNGASQPAVASSQPAKQSPGQARFADLGDPSVTVPTKIERYTDNLYEKIDGREGQYRSFGVVDLRFGQYLDTRGQQTFDTYLYDMAEPVNAMGIYMVERSPDVKLIQLGREGYASGASAYFWKGKYYVNVLGPAEGDANAAKTALRIAQAIADSIADDGQPVWADRLLPAQDRLPDSLSYAATSALGYDFLERLFKANYKTGETTYQAFLIKTDNPAKAAELFKKLAEATAKYDKVVARQPSPGGETFTGQSLDVYSVCFHKGVYLGGIIECGDQPLAEKKAAQLRDGLPGDGMK